MKEIDYEVNNVKNQVINEIKKDDEKDTLVVVKLKDL